MHDVLLSRRRNGVRWAGALSFGSVFATAPASHAEEAHIHVGPNHVVSVPRPDGIRNEVWAAASRKQPGTIVAVFHAGFITSRACENMITHDGGQRWQPVKLPKQEDCFDPMIVSGADGQFYISYSAYEIPPPPAGVARASSAPIKIYTSLDDGRSWSGVNELHTPVLPDHQRQSVDVSGGPYDGRVYMAWVEHPVHTLPGKMHLFLQHWDKDGRNVSEAKILYVDEQGYRPTSLEPLVFSDGSLAVVFRNRFNSYIGLDPRGEQTPMYTLHSQDGGATFGPPVKIGDVGLPVWRTRSHRFTGQTTAPIFVVDQSKSSQYRDRAYAVWNDTRNGTSDIWFIRSEDKGHTWSQPMRINDYAAPYSETTVPDFRMTPVVAVNKDGIVGVSWYDRREDPTRRCWKQYFSASIDGGRTFLRNRPIASAASCPNKNLAPAVEVYGAREDVKIPSWDELRALDMPYSGGSGSAYAHDMALARVRAESNPNNDKPRVHVSFDTGRGLFQGHYAGLVADADGSFQALWADRRLGSQEIFSTRVDVVTGAAPAAPQLERADLSKSVEVIAERVRFDEDTGITTLDLSLRNLSARPVYAPLTLKVRQVVAGGRNVFANADSGGANAGAEWDFSAALGTRKQLMPKMISEARTVKVHSAVAQGLDVMFDYEISGSVPAQ